MPRRSSSSGVLEKKLPNSQACASSGRASEATERSCSSGDVLWDVQRARISFARVFASALPRASLLFAFPSARGCARRVRICRAHAGRGYVCSQRRARAGPSHGATHVIQAKYSALNSLAHCNTTTGNSRTIWPVPILSHTPSHNRL